MAEPKTNGAANEPMGQFLSDLWKDMGAARNRAASAPTAGPLPGPTVLATPKAAAPTPLPTPVATNGFFPKAPKSLLEVGVSADEVGRYILKLLAARGAFPGRKIAAHIRMLFPLVEEVLKDLRREQYVVLKGEALAGDYTYVPTDKGLATAKEFSRDCTYYGATPVTLAQYEAVMKLQSMTTQKVGVADLKQAFTGLEIQDNVLRMLGPAVNSGRGLFLFGQPGNGKTSIAERVARAFGEAIWIPRAIGIDGLVIRIFDPSMHTLVSKDDPFLQRIDSSELDQRWVRIHRPTVIAGGELTMDELEVTRDTNSGICEAPLQLKSNGGVLLIDDFGRQRMPVDELLNRWIVPLEKRYDLLNLPTGKKVQVPFDQLVIFSTNLEPRDLVDDAFLRRIPYKIQVPNPSPEQFHHIFTVMCSQFGIPYEMNAVNYLIAEHYVGKNREMRACHPRDLLMQIRNLSTYEGRVPALTKDSIDFAVSCYFSILS